MGGVGRVTAALAEAAGRPHAIAALTSADSGPALRAAEADWLEVHAAALAWERRAGYPPPRQPRDMAGAADNARQRRVLRRRRRCAERWTTLDGRTARAAVAAGPASGLDEQAVTAALGDGVGGAARGGRGGILQPLCELGTLTAEAEARVPAGAVASVARLVAQPTYGDAAWAAAFSNGKYAGNLPAKGIVSTTVLAARQSQASLLRERIEDVVGEERLP
eukprot:5948870-Pleurochrysis_carterae.AAC.1